METILRYVIIAAVGALASILANQSIAVFNDGLRPVLPEYLEKRMDRKALAATSFAIGFGLVIGYGLPTSIAASIILIHCILLTTDIIGTWCPDTKKGMIVSGVIGAVYGVALLFGLQVIIDLFNLLPVNFLGSLGQVSAGITLAFAIFPAVTVALQFGAAKGIITAVVTLLVRQIVETYGKIALDAEHTISLNKDGMALLAGMIIMLVFAAMDKEGNDQNSNECLQIAIAKRQQAGVHPTLITLLALALQVHLPLCGHDGLDIVGLAQGFHPHIIVHAEQGVFEVGTGKAVLRDLADAAILHVAAEQPGQHHADLRLALTAAALDDHHALTLVAGDQAVADELLHRGNVLRVEQVGQEPQPMGGLCSFRVIFDREPVADDLRLALLKGAVQIQGSVCQRNAVGDRWKVLHLCRQFQHIHHIGDLLGKVCPDIFTHHLENLAAQGHGIGHAAIPG